MLPLPIPPYKSPFFLFNAHLQTIYPSLIRKVKDIQYSRTRLETPDADFLDLDWVPNQSERIIIISHGLEGNSERPYVKGMARIFRDHGWDALAWNFRGCSGEMNRQRRFYHSGATDDLGLVVQHVRKKHQYKRIVLAGFSLGGNLTLKYLGEHGKEAAGIIDKAVVFSVPLHLHSSSQKISQPSNYLYNRKFLKNLKIKIEAKAVNISDLIHKGRHPEIKTLLDFDNLYTAPLHGFADAAAYYEACSSIYFLKDIKIPTLIVNAQNDPFLSPECYPKKELKKHDFIKMEMPEQGGHCGFALVNAKNYFWSEMKALEFVG